MADIAYAPLTADNFNVFSLDKFIRRQHVRQCWRRVDGALVLRPVEYIEDWTLEERRSTAAEVLAGARLGSRGQYADLALFYVSEPFRGQGIGGRLFRMACAAARELGAEKLYISAHSAAEVMAAYWALGCVEAEEPDPRHAAEEPCDVQLEKRLKRP